MEIDPSQYKDLISRIVTPRPILLITTVNKDGLVNMAPFSAVTFAGYEPPTVLVSIGTQKHDKRFLTKDLEGEYDLEEKKDTLANIEYSREFVAHLATEELLDAIVIGDRRYPKEVSELTRAGLTAVPSRIVKPPRIKEAKVAVECQLVNQFNVRAGHVLVVGKGVAFYASEEALVNGRLDTSRIKPVLHYFGDLFAVCDRQIKKQRDRYKLD